MWISHVALKHAHARRLRSVGFGIIRACRWCRRMRMISHSMRAGLAILVVLGVNGRRRTGIVLLGGTTIWERCPEFERLRGIGRKGLPQSFDLSFDFRKWPCLGTFLQYTHMPSEVIASICVEFGIRGCYCDLATVSPLLTIIRQRKLTRCNIVQVRMA